MSIFQTTGGGAVANYSAGGMVAPVAGSMVAPISGSSVGLAKAQVTHGVRQVSPHMMF